MLDFNTTVPGVEVGVLSFSKDDEDRVDMLRTPHRKVSVASIKIFISSLQLKHLINTFSGHSSAEFPIGPSNCFVSSQVRSIYRWKFGYIY